MAVGGYPPPGHFLGDLGFSTEVRSDTAAVARGVANLARHVENLGNFGLPVVVALNRFDSDTTAEFAVVRAAMAALGVETLLCTHWSDGASGAADLAAAVQGLIAARASRFAPLYPDAMPLADKLRSIARRVYRASDIALAPAAAKRLAAFEARGFGHLPVCIAKTQYSLSDDPKRMGAPTGWNLRVTDVGLSAGAGFLVVTSGAMMLMPGLPKTSRAMKIDVDAQGEIVGMS